MSAVYILVGIAFIAFGVWLIIRKIKIFAKGEQGDLGYDAAGLVYGIICIIAGIILIAKYVN
jgi:amino acid transporter